MSGFWANLGVFAVLAVIVCGYWKFSEYRAANRQDPNEAENITGATKAPDRGKKNAADPKP